MKSISLTSAFVLFAFTSLYSQVDIDKAINLSGSGTDAKIMGIKQVSSAQDAVSAEVLQKGNLVYAVAGGNSSVYTITLSPGITAYTDGMEIRFKAPANNATGVQLNINSVGAKTIKKNVSTNLAANDILAGQLVNVIYDASADAFQLSSRIEQLSNTTTAGTYNNVTVNSQGLVTGGSNVAYISGNQNITLSGDVSGSGTTAITTTIGANAVTSSKILDGTIASADLATPAVNASNQIFNTLPVANGGTGTSSTPGNGQLLIGNGTNYNVANLTQGSGISITNGTGTITIATNGGTLNGGSTNYLPKWTSATTLSSTSLVYDNGTNVGIGTTTPGSKLHVEGGVLSGNNGGYFSTKWSGDNYHGIWYRSSVSADGNTVSAADAMVYREYGSASTGHHFWTGATMTERFRVTNDYSAFLTGNVGVGTTAPTVKLDVQGAITTNRNWYYLAGGGDANHAIGNIAGDGEQFRYWAFLDFYSPNAGGNIRFTNDGKVGIGTTTPQTRLEVVPPSTNIAAAVIRTSGGQSWGSTLTVATDGGNDEPRINFSYRGKAKHWQLGGYSNSNRFGIWEDGGDGVYGSGWGSERFTVAAGGRVGINQGGPNATLDVQGFTGPTHAIISAGGSYYTDWPGGWGGGLASWDMCVASIKYSGLTSRSDRRLKENISTLSSMNAMDVVRKLQPVSYNWIDKRLPQHRNYGFIAQEVEKLLPDLIDTGTDSLHTKGMHYQDLIAILTQAMKEQDEVIKKLQAENEALKATKADAAELDKLKAQMESIMRRLDTRNSQNGN